MTLGGGFVCLCPPKSLEIGEDGQLHRGDTESKLQVELETVGFPAGTVRFSHLSGGAVACSGGDVSAATEGHVLAVLRGKLDNYAYLVKKYCGEDADCNAVALKSLNDVRSVTPISPATLLCRLYLRLGKDMLAKLRGEFSLVCYDSSLVRVLAARDPSGAVDLAHGRCPSGSLVVSSGVQLPAGSTVEEMHPGFFKYGWYSKPLKYANELETVQREATAAASAARKALSGLLSKGAKVKSETKARPLTRKKTMALPVLVPGAPSAVKPQTDLVHAPRSRSPSPDTIGNVPRRVLDALAGPLAADKHQSKLLSTMLDTSPCALVITDARKEDNPIVYANPIFELRTGYSQEDVLGRNCRFLQAPPSQPRVPTFTSMSLKRSINEGSKRSVRLLNYRKDGTPMWNDLSLLPLRDATGTVTHFIGLQTFSTVEVHGNGTPSPTVMASPKASNQNLSKLTLNRSRSCNNLTVNSLKSNAQSFGDLHSLAGPASKGLAC